MESPTKQPGDKTFEVPSCTICLQDLVEDLSSLDCGHVYHLGCISQHFEYRGTCPNCQKRASLKEVRTIHFRLVPHSNALHFHLNTMLASIPSSQKQDLDVLIKDLKVALEANEKMKQQVGSLESDLRSAEKTVKALREDVYRLKDEGDKTGRENRELRKSCGELRSQLEEQVRVGEKLRRECERLRAEERDYDQMKRYQAVLQEGSPEIVNYKNELEAKSTPPQDIAKAFFEMLLMKNLEVLRAKNKLKEIAEHQGERDGEATRLKTTVEALRRELKELGEKRNGDRRRLEDIKEKYRVLGEKAKLKGIKEVEPMLDENSQTFNKSVHFPDDPVIQSTLRKPSFSQANTIGGFLKRRPTHPDA